MDFGTGTGIDPINLNKAGFTNISGCDNSEPMLEIAK